MNIPSRAFAFGIAACLAFHCDSDAAVVIDNLATGSQSFSESLSGPDGQDFFGDPYADHEIAFSFTTGSVDVQLAEIAFLTSIGGNGTSAISLEISTGSSVPGGTNPFIFGEGTPSGPSPVTQLITVNPGSPAQLLANTQYWVRFTVPTGTDVYTIHNTNTPTLAPGWSLGTTWRTEPGIPWEEINNTLYPKVRLTILDTIPEPGSILTTACGLVILLARRSRKTPSIA